MDGRKIIVLWNFAEATSSLPKTVKWEDKDQIKYMILNVGSGNKDLLAAIILPNVIDTDDEFKAILKLAADIAKEKDYIILVHKTTKIGGCKITEDEKRNMLNKHFKERYELFGGGDSKIYKQLLSTNTTFSKNVFGDSGEVKKTVFNAIWNEYNVKKKIIRLKFDILSKCLPIVIAMRGLKECADGGDSTKTSEYLSKIKAQKNWVLPSKIPLDKHICPSDELCEEIEKAIQNISSLGKKIEAPSITAQDVVSIMYSKQFNIDDWYSELGKSFERYT